MVSIRHISTSSFLEEEKNISVLATEENSSKKYKSVPIKDLNNDDIWYQVLLIKADSIQGKLQILETKPKGKFTDVVIDNSKDSQTKKIQDCLPSRGVKFPEELQDILLNNPVSLSNYYNTVQTLLQTRKISQLIARSWWAYRIYQDFLESLKNENLDLKMKNKPEKDDDYYYQNGNWEELLGALDKFLLENSHPSSNEKDGRILSEYLKKNIYPDEIEQIVLDILDGLIIRDIFLTANASSRDITEIKEDKDKNTSRSIYEPNRTYEESPETIMVILPSSRSWTGVRLALLFAGQVFRKTYKKDGGQYVVQDTYHQICQPIMSTSEIVSHYSIESSMESFHGQIDEIPVGLGFDLPYLKVIIPYPPIPSEDQVKREKLEQWFNATDDDSKLGFFCKNKDGEYTTTIRNPTPPYPYIPISSS